MFLLWIWLLWLRTKQTNRAINNLVCNTLIHRSFLLFVFLFRFSSNGAPSLGTGEPPLLSPPSDLPPVRFTSACESRIQSVLHLPAQCEVTMYLAAAIILDTTVTEKRPILRVRNIMILRITWHNWQFRISQLPTLWHTLTHTLQHPVPSMSLHVWQWYQCWLRNSLLVSVNVHNCSLSPSSSYGERRVSTDTVLCSSLYRTCIPLPLLPHHLHQHHPPTE